MQHFFSIIIVTWNGLEHLKEFLPSVLETDYEQFEIIIADNASTDGTREWIQKHAPSCRIVTFSENHGYCGGNNRAVPYADGNILLFLNNDVRVDPSWLTHLNQAFSETSAAIVQPRVRSHLNPEYFEYAGAAGGLIDRLGYPFCRGRLFDNVEKDEGQYNKRTEIFWASGAAFAIRKEIFTELSGFDEEFEFHMEEIDLCWNAWNKGYKTLYEPQSIVYHLGGGSMPMGSPRKVYYNYRNSLLMLTKNLDVNPVRKIFMRLCLDGVAGIRSMLMLKPAETFAIIKAHFGYYKRLPSMIQKRKSIQSGMNGGSPSKPIYPGLIIIEAFIRGKKKSSDII